MPRRDLTLENRIALLEQIKSQPPNTSHRRLAEITGVPKSTIARMIQQQDKLKEEWALCKGQQRTSQKRKRKSKDPDVEEALNQWFSVVTGQGVCVSGPMLKSKSEELAKKIGHENFKATDGWLSRWKSRYNIKLKKVHIKDSSDSVSTGQWKSTKLSSLLQKFCADDIYNADETSLFYCATPDSFLSCKRAALFGSKKVMDHVTVLCCSNMSGSDKRKLLVVGKSTKPQCFKGLRMDSLPVLYCANKNAWMTSEIFKKWLISWDVELEQKSRKILLLLDNCVVHPHLDCLKNIHLEFLPINNTSLVQPMNMGIIKNLKILYHEKLVNYILEAIEENLLTSSMAKESARINLLQAVQFVADSWREISNKTIQHCFAQCGFKHPDLMMPDTMNNENATISELQHIISYKGFVYIDDDIQCYNENEDCEDENVEEILAKQQDISEDQESDEIDDTPEVDRVSDRDARKFVARLQHYFMQEGNEGSPLSALDICADFVYFQSVKRRRQDSRDKFLHH
ncbi:tigger transposable element-derived protein 6-like [Centruroides vittatus]|uniref:tigger transposable element-derived protein 6-like n=1 Tax=Centruroides vittatus TaxID=120091 RepID=UPI003510695E